LSLPVWGLYRGFVREREGSAIKKGGERMYFYSRG
jgi:hypothetical protein